jgi:hypothetical protein
MLTWYCGVCVVKEERREEDEEEEEEEERRWCENRDVGSGVKVWLKMLTISKLGLVSHEANT